MIVFYCFGNTWENEEWEFCPLVSVCFFTHDLALWVSVRCLQWCSPHWELIYCYYRSRSDRSRPSPASGPRWPPAPSLLRTHTERERESRLDIMKRWLECGVSPLLSWDHRSLLRNLQMKYGRTNTLCESNSSRTHRCWTEPCSDRCRRTLESLHRTGATFPEPPDPSPPSVTHSAQPSSETQQPSSNWRARLVYYTPLVFINDVL